MRANVRNAKATRTLPCHALAAATGRAGVHTSNATDNAQTPHTNTGDCHAHPQHTQPTDKQQTHLSAAPEPRSISTFLRRRLRAGRPGWGPRAVPAATKSPDKFQHPTHENQQFSASQESTHEKNNNNPNANKNKKHTAVNDNTSREKLLKQRSAESTQKIDINKIFSMIRLTPRSVPCSTVLASSSRNSAWRRLGVSCYTTGEGNGKERRAT